ncbi:hypothetical protein FOZ61_005671 [Perkinsus olseni]|uniref:SAP domain-containing protein n=1 Tax=Perkinsus olseni TaxID=32597 RepID=A0A7J6LGF8_PEROL|nr:hypothetical protein FOZ61_005671 [Perkinsus olseni]
MADLHQQFGAMRVGQLRTLCRQKGIASDGGKRDLVQRLCELADQAGAPTDTSDCQSVPGDVILEPGLSHEELHELATIADEIRHIRKQTFSMPTIQQCQNRTTHKRDSYGFTAEAGACKHTRSSLSSLRSLLRSGVSVDKVFCVILSLIVHGIAFYVLLSISLIIWENYIIEACISRWKMELQSFDTGPEPAWLDNPPTDFLHLPPGTDKYVNFSLSLSLKNSPPWLGVELSSVGILFFE